MGGVIRFVLINVTTVSPPNRRQFRAQPSTLPEYNRGCRLCKELLSSSGLDGGGGRGCDYRSVARCSKQKGPVFRNRPFGANAAMRSF
jgi:hypothetical protein